MNASEMSRVRASFGHPLHVCPVSAKYQNGHLVESNMSVPDRFRVLFFSQSSGRDDH